MEHDPRLDAGFQRILADIMKGIVPADIAATPATSGKYVKDLDAEGIEELTELRINFFWSHCFKNILCTQDDCMSAFQAFAAARDTPAAQRFIQKNPQHFANVDLALCRVVNSIRNPK